MGMELVKKNYNGLDLGKFLCALLILFYHYFSEHGPIHPLFEDFLSLYAVAVALFMVISGFLTFNKIETVDNTKERWRIVANQVKRILTVYALWSVPYLIYQIATWEWSTISFGFVFQELQRWIFSSSFYTIWFLPSLAVGLILAFWITEKLPIWLAAVIGVVLYVISALMQSYSFIGNQIPLFKYFVEFCNTWLGGSRGWLVFATPLLMLGKLVVNIKNKIRLSLSFVLSILFMGALLCEAIIIRSSVGGMGVDATVMLIPAITFITCFLLNFTLPNGSYLIWMRKMSVLIFVSQRIFLTVLPTILPAAFSTFVFANAYMGCVIICGSTIVFCAAIILLSKKFNYLKKLY